MKDENCRFCNPEKVDWSENGFYGIGCPGCSEGKTAFIIKEDHGDITEDQKQLISKLIKEHYPNMKSTGQAERRKSHYHWYDFLKKVET